MTRALERRVHGLAALLAISAAAYLAFAMQAPNAPARAPREIDPQAAKRLMDAGAVFIDVRARDAFASGHIPGAIALPLAELPGAMPTSPTIDRTQPIVVYGRDAGDASRDAASRVADAGFSGAMALKGGIASWLAAGLPVEPPAPVAAPERVAVNRVVDQP